MLSKPRHNALISLLAIAFVLISVIVCSAEKANYVYDKENRLIRVEYESGTTEEYYYDAVGNLVSQNVMYNISVTPTAYNFGTVYVGATSTATIFTVQNSGAANLLIGSITLSGFHPSQFGIRNDNCSGHTVSTNGSCTVQAVFSPTSDGTKNANLVIHSSDPDMPNLKVPLSGTAVYGYTLTITKNGIGTGTVTSNPSGINCGNDCAERYSEGTEVTVTAIPNTDSVFSGWSGGGCSGIANCKVTMIGNITITATFNGKYSISGTVAKTNKKPISGVTMILSGAATGTTTTNTNGNYTFSGIVNGTYTITPQKAGYTFTPKSRTIIINGANVVGQDFTDK